MSGDAALPPMRVERALDLLPDIDVLAPLRARLISTSRVRPPAEPYRTVGKRMIPQGNLKEIVPRALERVTEHLAALYETAVEALACEQRGDQPAAVRALLRAGSREERVGRRAQARVWFRHALSIAQGLRDRGPEIEALRHLAGLESGLGNHEQAARSYQRSLALAEAEGDDRSCAIACQGLAEVSLSQGKWQGAESWCSRALKHAGEDRQLKAGIYLGLGEVARERRRIDVAEGLLNRARILYEEIGDAVGMIRALNAWGMFEGARERRPDALANYREALARSLHLSERSPRLEIAIRLNICQLYLEWGRLPDAEDEARRVEEAAIVHALTEELAHAYVVIGKVRALRSDDRGFVFYEKALELCRQRDPSPTLEAEVYLEYGVFQRQLGLVEEARAYLERSREILQGISDVRMLERVGHELQLTKRE